MTDTQKYQLPVLIYDSECTLCNRFKLALDRIPETKYISKVSLHDEKLYEQFPFLTIENCEAELHLLLENDQVLVGKQALKYLISSFPAVSKFSWLIDSKMGQKALDLFYESTKRYRESLLNRCPKCKNKGSNAHKNCSKNRRPEA